MASAVTPGRLRATGLVVVIVGALFFVAGMSTYAVVSKELADQRITVSRDATFFAGQQITQPWQAYAEAMVIQRHAGQIAGGKTYAELPQSDPNRQTVMTASFLQASLFTSVVAFGVAVLAAVVGALFVLIGLALRGLSAPVGVGAATTTTAESPSRV